MEARNYGLGGAAGAATAPREQTHAEQVDTELSRIQESANELLGKLMDLRDRAIGSSPQKEGSPTVSPVPTGIFGNLHDKCGRLSMTLGSLHNMVAELQKVI